MAGHKLTVVDEEKDIGVIMHKSLKPSRQCKKAARTASAALRQLTRNFHYRDRNIVKTLYIQYVSKVVVRKKKICFFRLGMHSLVPNFHCAV